jgi:hypothetical protein
MGSLFALRRSLHTPSFSFEDGACGPQAVKAKATQCWFDSGQGHQLSFLLHGSRTPDEQIYGVSGFEPRAPAFAIACHTR